MSILVTGGTGFIGSHIVVELLTEGCDVVIVDNLCNSKAQVVDRIEQITGRTVTFYQYDLCDLDKVYEIFGRKSITDVIHLAGFKAVGESVEKPLKYYDNNLTATINLLKAMERASVTNLVFSSSATVYGTPSKVPIKEDFPTGAVNPYGASKLMIENILADVANASPQMNVILLRYFNPVGAHRSGLIGESPNGIPNNLMPYILSVALGKLPHLNIFGSDYDTRDGTGVRDYIHVVDLARGHLAALGRMSKNCGLHVYNLGTGKGYSVLEVVEAFRKSSGIGIKYELAARRAGDVAECYADVTKAYDELGWQAVRDIEEMCGDSWRFAQSEVRNLEVRS